jgi:hypothetical protein
MSDSIGLGSGYARLWEPTWKGEPRRCKERLERPTHSQKY